MANAQKMTDTEIYRWGAFKLRGSASHLQTSEFEKLDLKWTLEKVDLVIKTVEKLRLPEFRQ